MQFNAIQYNNRFCVAQQQRQSFTQNLLKVLLQLHHVGRLDDISLHVIVILCVAKIINAYELLVYTSFFLKSNLKLCFIVLM